MILYTWKVCAYILHQTFEREFVLHFQQIFKLLNKKINNLDLAIEYINKEPQNKRWKNNI